MDAISLERELVMPVTIRTASEHSHFNLRFARCVCSVVATLTSHLITDRYKINACLQERDSARMSLEVRRDTRPHSCIGFVRDSRLLTENPIGAVLREGIDLGRFWSGASLERHYLERAIALIGFDCFGP